MSADSLTDRLRANADKRRQRIGPTEDPNNYGKMETVAASQETNALLREAADEIARLRRAAQIGEAGYERQKEKPPDISQGIYNSHRQLAACCAKSSPIARLATC